MEDVYKHYISYHEYGNDIFELTKKIRKLNKKFDIIFLIYWPGQNNHILSNCLVNPLSSCYLIYISID